MQPKFPTPQVRLTYLLALVLVGVVTSCGNSDTITQLTAPETQQGITCGATGVVVPVEVHSGASDLNVSFSAEPATIAVSPSTSLTDQNGNATAYALVPYGTQGDVVASAIGATTGGITVSTTVAPVMFQLISLAPDTEVGEANGEVGSVGQIYAVAVQVNPPSLCTAPLGGLPVTLGVVQASATASGSSASTGGSSASAGGSSSGSSASATTGSSPPGSVTVFTDKSGLAQAKILVPWGADALLQVSGGAQVQWFPVADDLANPATIACLTWAQQPTPQSNVYAVTATVNYTGNGLTGPFPGLPVAFSIAFPIPATTMMGAPATIAPASAITSQSGTATAYVTLQQSSAGPTMPPVVVEAVAGSSAATVAINSGASGSSPSPCPASP
ncbi:MAG TPA: hypothetical protein VK745_21720 [Polyangiaceae bacterium]|nr:hypothetical protein [Polyangiaceae bacterium]